VGPPFCSVWPDIDHHNHHDHKYHDQHDEYHEHHWNLAYPHDYDHIGRVMYEKVYTSSKTITLPGSGETWGQMVYNKTWDSIFAISSMRWWRIFRDGTAKPYGKISGSYSIFGRVGGYPCSGIGTVGRFYACNDINGLPDQNTILNPDHVFSIGLNWPSTEAGYVDDLNQVVLRYSYGTLQVFDINTGLLLRSISSGITGSSYPRGSISWAGDGLVCIIIPSTGKVAFVDYLSLNESVETGAIDVCLMAVYDCLNKVIISLSSDKRVRVYVRDSWPVTLSNPVFVPTTVRAAVGNTVKVRLTGQTGEPCVGWWIHWELQSVGGLGPYGSLVHEVSETDENGYAWNTYCGPEDSYGQTRVVCRVVLT
jgi:hypothetical protein